MAKYKKKPITIESFQLGVDYIPDWAMDKVTENSIILHGDHNGKVSADIITLEGTMLANYGDYIIKGINGEIYPCKEDIFTKTYEKTEKGNLEELFNEAMKIGGFVIIYTMFEHSIIECAIYSNNFEKVWDIYKPCFDDNLKSLYDTSEIVEATCVGSLADYFSDNSQRFISNRIYEKTGIRI